MINQRIEYFQGFTYQAFDNDNLVFQGTKEDCWSFLAIDEVKGEYNVELLINTTFQVTDFNGFLAFQGSITDCYNFLIKKKYNL